MLGLSSVPSSAHPLEVERLVERVEHRGGDLEGTLDRVVAVHEHLGLDDRHDARLLAQRGVARQRVGVHVDAVRARQGVVGVIV